MMYNLINSEKVVENHHLLLNWSTKSLVFTIFCFVTRIRVALSVLCPDWPVYAAPLSGRWYRVRVGLISSPCSDLPLSTTACLHATPSVSSCSSWDRPVYSTATFSAMFLPQFKLDLNKRATTNKIKCKPARTATAKLLQMCLMLQLALAC